MIRNSFFFRKNMGLIHWNLLFIEAPVFFIVHVYLTFTDVKLHEQDSNRNQVTKWKVLSPSAIQVRQDLVLY